MFVADKFVTNLLQLYLSFRILESSTTSTTHNFSLTDRQYRAIAIHTPQEVLCTRLFIAIKSLENSR
jgi:hypothetical protein